MLTGIHFILTYACNFECDHCFLYCSPWSQGTFTINQVNNVLDEAEKINSVDWIFFEGGEPFLYFPLLMEGIRQAKSRGFKVGIVTNAYGANSPEDAELWLRPLKESGMSFMNISNDTFHYGEEDQNPAMIASSVAKKLGIESSSICIDPPKVMQSGSHDEKKGNPVVGGVARFRGRAAEKLAENLPLRPWEELNECPDEDIESPSRVHIDPYGNVHICQGISMGNMWETPLSKLVADYHADSHPICGPVLKGGPAALVKELGIKPDDGYIDECHLCYLSRKAVMDKYPDYLTPGQVYGLE